MNQDFSITRLYRKSPPSHLSHSLQSMSVENYVFYPGSNGLNRLKQGASHLNIGLGHESLEEIEELPEILHLKGKKEICSACKWPRLNYYTIKDCTDEAVLCQVCLVRYHLPRTSGSVIHIDHEEAKRREKVWQEKPSFQKWTEHAFLRCCGCDKITFRCFYIQEINARFCYDCAETSPLEIDRMRAKYVKSLKPNGEMPNKEFLLPQGKPGFVVGAFKVECNCDVGSHSIKGKHSFKNRHITIGMKEYHGVHKLELSFLDLSYYSKVNPEIINLGLSIDELQKFALDSTALGLYDIGIVVVNQICKEMMTVVEKLSVFLKQEADTSAILYLSKDVEGLNLSASLQRLLKVLIVKNSGKAGIVINRLLNKEVDLLKQEVITYHFFIVENVSPAYVSTSIKQAKDDCIKLLKLCTALSVLKENKASSKEPKFNAEVLPPKYFQNPLL